VAAPFLENSQQMSKPLVLIIEDESAIRDMLRLALENAEFNIIEAGNVAEAAALLDKEKPEIILLDWMLPGGSGMEYIAKLKSSPSTKAIPIIMLTARAEEHNKVVGLEQGADDYITKPFSPRELIARIRSVLRRGGRVMDGYLSTGALRINEKTNEVWIQNEKLSLTPIEFQLLLFFVKHPRRVYSREQLLDHVWPRQEDILPRVVDVNIKRLRHRLKPFNYENAIVTVRGIGYQFKENLE
jgi:two-component system phosphate regulon response regulator PhoB